VIGNIAILNHEGNDDISIMFSYCPLNQGASQPINIPNRRTDQVKGLSGETKSCMFGWYQIFLNELVALKYVGYGLPDLRLLNYGFVCISSGDRMHSRLI
jgi:hypothetical protein